ncbi:MAG: ABC transporter substrate-binding protein [Dehalococcoidia bacterium]|nr:ABC transporter substrate-binding protein [Dehalococcoidia bacterium]
MPPVLLSERPTSLVLDPIEDTTRRRFITGAGAAALAAAFLAACGDGGSGDEPEGETRSVDDYFGAVTVPATPRRVVSADDATLAAMVVLGAPPIASYFNYTLSEPAYLGEGYQSVENINNGETGEIDFERALALNPDLMITMVGVPDNLFYEELYHRYQAAVPTFGWLRDQRTLDSLRTNFFMVARALDLESRAVEIFDEVEERIGELRERVSKLEEAPRVNFVRVWPDFLHVRFADPVAVLVREIGLEWGLAPSPDEFAIDISLEQVRLLDEADALFVMVNGGADAAFDQLVAEPLWEQVTPVKNQAVHRVPDYWLNGDPTALKLILDDLERLVVAPAEG